MKFWFWIRYFMLFDLIVFVFMLMFDVFMDLIIWVSVKL